VSLDDRSQTLNYRIAEAERLKTPYMAVIGKREAEAGTVALRQRGAGRKQEIVDLSALIERLRTEISSRALGAVPERVLQESAAD